MDKIEIAARNYYLGEGKDLREEMENLLKEAYVRGFKRGVKKTKELYEKQEEYVPKEM